MKRQTDIKNDSPPFDDCPEGITMWFIRLPNFLDTAQNDSTADRFGSRDLLFLFSLLMISFLLMPGCNEPFQPLQKNDTVPFSMTGYLDASADTQWVRITPLREQVESFSEIPEMKVTIKNLKSGKTAVMNSTLTPFYLPSGYNALNSSTTMEIEAGETYQITAEQPDGATSTAEVTLPEDFPTPKINYIDNTGCLVTLKTSGVENLADVQYRMRIRVRRPGLDFVTNVSAPYRHRTYREAEGRYSTTINVQSARNRTFDEFGGVPANTTIDVLERYFFVVSGGPEWTEIEEQGSVDEVVFTLPNFISNVENGVGYMFGIVSKSIPDVGCPRE